MYASATMAKQILFGTTLALSGGLFGSLNAQETVSISGIVSLQSSHEGIPEVSVTLCPDTARQVVSATEGVVQLPSRDQVLEIRLAAPGEPRQITVTSVFPDCPNAQRDGYFGQALRRSSPPVVTESVTVTAQGVTYHPNVTEKTNAKTIVLREGEEVVGIDVVLQGLR